MARHHPQFLNCAGQTPCKNVMNKTYMTAAQADAFMSENPQFSFEFGSAKTDMGEEPAYVYVDGGVKYLVIRDEVDHPAIFAFQSWSNGNDLQKSALYGGQEALDFISRHEESGTFATLHTFSNHEDAEAAYADL